MDKTNLETLKVEDYSAKEIKEDEENYNKQALKPRYMAFFCTRVWLFG